jgi:hypothetical protein
MAKTDWELLAKSMREDALLSEAPDTIYEIMYQPSEEQKKMYFNAGRWAGGSKDYTARQANIQLQELGDA